MKKPDFPTPEDEFFFQIAYQEACTAFEEGEIPVGAVIVSEGILLAKGRNAVERLHDPTAHAELLALTSATYGLQAKYLRKCTLYVTLEPCPMCAAALRWAQMGRIVYGAEDDKNGYRAFSEKLVHPKTIIHSGYRSAECAELMKSFFRGKRGR